MDNWFAFRQCKTKILLYPHNLTRIGNPLKELVFYKVSRTADVPEDRSNIFKSDLFKLFPNLEELELWTTHNGDYPLNAMSLLSVLSESEIPETFEMLKIWDDDQKWMKNAFEAIPDLKEQFAEKGWQFEMETVDTWNEEGEEEDWVFIRRMK